MQDTAKMSDAELLTETRNAQRRDRNLPENGQPAAGAAQYRIRQFLMLPASGLRPHPDALACPADADDRAAVTDSVAEMGVIQPLLVSPPGEDNIRLVYDGCGRLAAAGAGAILPCLEVEAANPRQLALNVNSAGRKRSTGSRVLYYVLAHADKVLAAWKAGNEVSKGGAVSYETALNKKGVPADLQPWTAREIAIRLQVSKNDVLAAIQLARCQMEGYVPRPGAYKAGVEPLADAAKAAPLLCNEQGEGAETIFARALERTFNAVLTGAVPIRTWTKAFKGSAATNGRRRPDPEYGPLLIRATNSLCNAFRHWTEIRGADRDIIIDKVLPKIAAEAPEEARRAFEAALAAVRRGAGKEALQ